MKPVYQFKPVKFPTRRRTTVTYIADLARALFGRDAGHDAMVALLGLFIIGGIIGWIDMLINLFEVGMR